MKQFQFDKFIYEEGTKKIFVTKCIDYKTKYFVKGDTKCYASCPPGYDFKDETNKECLKSCLDNSNGKQFYYSSDKNCINYVQVNIIMIHSKNFYPHVLDFMIGMKNIAIKIILEKWNIRIQNIIVTAKMVVKQWYMNITKIDEVLILL